ncbi:MAG: hypothetical protein IID61_01590 [SAR324 cluster bacterium]|nr:hypothetical protein [SAR324 cluster bacterium]
MLRRWLREPRGTLSVAVLDDELAALFGAKSRTVYLSAATMAKQKRNHPELDAEEYALLPDVIARGEVIQQGGLRLVFFLSHTRLMKAVLKSTRQRDELYVVSYQRANERERIRLRRRGQILRKELT